jgi:predicted XRE-type DNA-binding protein
MATTRVCSIEGCNKKLFGRGWCQAHWAKWRKYGDPLAGRNYAPRGAGYAWILEHVAYDGEDCLFWPFSRGKWGYGDLWVDGKHWPVHRFMCQLVYGDPPSPSHEVLHSCGNGCLGCTNPNHLRYGTSKENSADTIHHGNSMRGERAHQSKLTEADVLQIRDLAASGMSQTKIAKQFGICQQSVSDIHRRKNWHWL